MKLFKEFVYLIKHLLFPLRLSILSIFMFLFVSTIVILVTISYVSSSTFLVYIADKSMQDVSKSLYQLFIREVSLAERDNKFSASLILTDILNPNDINKMSTYFSNLATQFYLAQSVYWGDVNGNYIAADYEADDTITSEIIEVNNKNPTRLQIFRDVHGNTKKYARSNVFKYSDPRNRPWYLVAKKAKTTAWTNVYLFEPKHYLGISVATPVYKKDGKLQGVLGIDLRLDWISWYINEQNVSPNGILFIVRDDGKIIAFPDFDKLSNQSVLIDIHDLNRKWITESFNIFKTTHHEYFSFEYKGEIYLARYHPISLFKDQHWIIGIVIPKNDFIGELNRARVINIAISLIILLIGILAISKFVNRLVRPIKHLIRETKKIKELNLEEDGRVISRIKEIIQLSDAIHAMKIGLKAFKAYVPSILVKQLIEKGEDAKLGGSKKNVVVFFSDIKDFTAITHHTDANQLMSQLSEYFQALSSIIISEGGTIDKYIGDSIMAFWGAPLTIKNPCEHAASAALQCIKKLEALNNDWQKKGKFPFFTRIGIHMGDAIVGNLGSSERINYTAMGETINIASRLEGLNKKFSTDILVSNAVYGVIKHDFILRKKGPVTLKGLDESSYVYELVSRKSIP